MKGFWNYLSNHYLKIGGTVKRGNKVIDFTQEHKSWNIKTNKRNFKAKKVISSLPIDLLQTICPDPIKNKLQPFITKNEKNYGSAVVVFLGVPEEEVSDQILSHHHESKLGNGNNMFISVSDKDDHISAPQGFRAVIISTHCELAEWQNLSEKEYQIKK